MSKKISDRLLQECQKAEQAEPQRQIPVIVTTTSNVDRSVLEQGGLKITHAFENIPAVSGTLTAREIQEIAKLPQVTMIEYDGKVKAISN